MDTTKQYQDQQEAIRLQSRITSFMQAFKIGTLLHSSGIRKVRGASPLTLFSAIFMLPFEGVNFSKGIVQNNTLGFKKDSAYDFLKNPKHNWRKFLFGLVTVVIDQGRGLKPQPPVTAYIFSFGIRTSRCLVAPDNGSRQVRSPTTA